MRQGLAAVPDEHGRPCSQLHWDGIGRVAGRWRRTASPARHSRRCQHQPSPVVRRRTGRIGNGIQACGTTGARNSVCTCRSISPASIGGSPVQQNSEALAGTIRGQAASPGVPIHYLNLTSIVEMPTDSPALRNPESAQSILVSGQMARRFIIPVRETNTTVSSIVDARPTCESSMAIIARVSGHMNEMTHVAGWLEGGFACSFERLDLDTEHLQLKAALPAPIDFCVDALGIEANAEVGPAGHTLVRPIRLRSTKMRSPRRSRLTGESSIRGW